MVLIGESGVERSRAQFNLFTHDEVINLISVWILEDSWIRNGDRVGQTVTIYFEKWKFADGLNKTAKSTSIRNLSAANNVYLITLVFADWPKSQVVFVIPFIFANFENKFSLNYYYMYLKKIVLILLIAIIGLYYISTAKKAMLCWKCPKFSHSLKPNREIQISNLRDLSFQSNGKQGSYWKFFLSWQEKISVVKWEAHTFFQMSCI